MIDRPSAKPKFRTPAEVTLDKQAEAWAKGRGVTLPSDDAGRVLGGHVEERGGKVATTHERQERAGVAPRERLLSHREWIRVRLGAIHTTRAALIDEARVLEGDARILDMRLVECLGVKQIGARLRKSHPWVVGKLARIEAQIAAREDGGRLVAAAECSWCGRGIIRAGCPGKPPKYCKTADRNCRRIAANARLLCRRANRKYVADMSQILPEPACQSHKIEIVVIDVSRRPYRQGHN